MDVGTTFDTSSSDVSKWYQQQYDKYSKPAKELDSTEYAKLAKEAYMDPSEFVSDRYTVDFELSNRNRTVFYDNERETAIIAFRGTNPSNVNDLASDAYITFGAEDISTRFTNAYAAVQRARLKYGYERVEVTGHSLGGSQALYVNRQLNVKAWAFNPGAGPGRFTSDVSDRVLGTVGLNYRHSNKANVYLVAGDPISTGYALSNQTVRYAPKRSRSAHAIDNFL